MLDRLLESVRRGESGVLVIRGEAGVGKTALLRYCARQASGFRVAQIGGVESEMELLFAGLHQLCAPMLDRLGALPEPQQHALRVAFGLSSGDAPDRFLVAWAFLQTAQDRMRCGGGWVTARVWADSLAQWLVSDMSLRQWRARAPRGAQRQAHR
jgi:AAA ATPase domain